MIKALVAAASLMVAVTPTAAMAQTATPAAAVRAAYTCVFSHACQESTVRAYLTPAFAKEFAEVDALEKRCHCEVIDASPWIDAQAGPGAFSVGAARIRGNRASVPIRFSGGKTGGYSLTIETERTASGWAISDILMRNGASTAAMMAKNIASTQAAATTPDAVFHQFEKWYNQASMSGSLTRSFDTVKAYLTPSFVREVQPKLSQPVDPFTLGTTPVTDWESSKAKVDGDAATTIVRLQFRGGSRSQVIYHLERIGGHWAISGVSK